GNAADLRSLVARRVDGFRCGRGIGGENRAIPRLLDGADPAWRLLAADDVCRVADRVPSPAHGSMVNDFDSTANRTGGPVEDTIRKVSSSTALESGRPPCSVGRMPSRELRTADRAPSR